MLFPGHISQLPGNHMPGLVAEALLAPKEWLASVASPDPAPDGILPNPLIGGDHLFISPDHGFISVKLIGRSANITLSRTGELGSRSTNGTFEGIAVGINPEIFRLMGWNFEGILLSKDLQCGDEDRYLQLGTACTSAYDGDHEFTTGTEGGDGRKATTLRFESSQPIPYIYTGAVTMATFPIES